MNRKIESSVENVTPVLARAWRDNCAFPRQRRLTNGHIEELALEIEARRYVPGLQVYFGAYPDGSEVLLNGNHTMEAIVLAGVPLALTVTRVSVADEDDAGRIYAVFDTHKTRNWRDSLTAMCATVPTHLETKALGALGMIESGFGEIWTRDVRRSRVTRVQALDLYRPALQNISEALKTSSNEAGKFFRMIPIFAIALLTFRYQLSMSAEFWERFLKDEGLVKGDPQRALLSLMRNLPAGSGGAARQVYLSKAAGLAWNASWRGETVEVVKPTQMIDFYLHGTPWHRPRTGLKSADVHTLATNEPARRAIAAVVAVR